MTEPKDIVDLLLHEHIKRLGVVPALLMADAAEEIRKLRARLSAPLPEEIIQLCERLRKHGHDEYLEWEVASALERMARDRKVLEAARDAAITYGQDRYQESLAEIARLEAERDRLLAVATELDDHVNKAEAERDAIRAKTIEECAQLINKRNGPHSADAKALRALAGKDKSE